MNRTAVFYLFVLSVIAIIGVFALLMTDRSIPTEVTAIVTTLIGATAGAALPSRTDTTTPVVERKVVAQ